MEVNKFSKNSSGRGPVLLHTSLKFVFSTDLKLTFSTDVGGIVTDGKIMLEM